MGPMKKPSDLQVQFYRGDEGEELVVIPPLGFRFAFLVPAIATGGMLTLWVRGLVSALRGPFFSAEPLLIRLFAGLWLCVWLAFGFLFMALAVFALFVVFGTEEIDIGSDETSRTRALFGLRHTQHFPTQHVSGIGLPVPPWGRAGKSGGVEMQVGRRRLRIALRITGAQAELLALELNRLLQSHRH